MNIKQLLKSAAKHDQQNISIKGWLTNSRGNAKIKFLEINDGSTFENLQLVLKNDKATIEQIETLNLGAAIEVKGVFAYTPQAQQKGELLCSQLTILAHSNAEFPIQNQEMSSEFLRSIPHIRHRTKLFRAVMRIRSTLAFEIHEYFRKHDFLYLSSPIITSNDGEGAGEAFVVDNEEKDFFNKKATLGVTGQLHAEAYALGFQKVYTFAPTFRAERSNTKKHAAEFWMIEPEVSFYKLKDIIHLGDSLLKTVIKNTIKKHPAEFEYFQKNIDANLVEKLQQFYNNKLTILEYRQAIEILKKNKAKFEFQDIEFGTDLKTEHERFLAEEVVKGPVAIVNYPKEIKAFYMHQNDDGQTVAAFDLLVPGIGELIGGSQREVRYDKLFQRLKNLNMEQEDLQWYLDLRKFGNYSSAGFGLGFERLIMYVTGVDNIRDSIPYPRTNKNLMM
ncbi:asparagine--tRNA ligase [Mesomycoplasma hyorhinis]|uniref:asparagine--tRNA ligase n=1 Tax=Mesomycoplasma hyorhinis TaxID=2100 RepID=UPI001C03CB4A|nr:asparagine--tRNA ligase [Mesomycoplasma hyorhinis]